MSTQTQQKKDTGKTSTTGTTKVTTHVPKKALAVVSADEVGRIIDLGLGRGVDATNPSPWLNKSSFQVRRVTIENIIGTEEGGALQSYEREISSVTTQQSDLKASIAVPQAPVNLGLEGELSRSVSKSRKALGKQIVNRTVSFRADFDDVPESVDKNDTTEKAKVESLPPRFTYIVSDPDTDHTSDDVDTPLAAYTDPSDFRVEALQSKFTFEERLSKFILERALRRQELKKKEAIKNKTQPPDELHLRGENPLEDMASYLNQVDKEESKMVVDDCADFVRHFRITHYVSSIQLGASQYRIINETEYYTKVSSGGTFGFEALANVAVKVSGSKKVTKKASDLRQIGKIVSEKVARGTYDEAVVGIKIQPIHTLVRLRFLHLAMRRVLLDYIDEQGDTSSGPFLIGCGDENIYWRVNKERDYAVEATSNIHDASLFYIIPFDDGDHPFEFNIGWQGDSLELYRKTLNRNSSSLLTPHSPGHREPLFRYLDAKVNIFGSNPGPLHLKEELEAQYSRLTLHQRIIGRSLIPVDTRGWVQGRDHFFIGCARRTLKKDGFVAVKRIRQRRRRHGVDDPEFITSCVPSEGYHNERIVYMLFRILPPSVRDVITEFPDNNLPPSSPVEDKINREFREYFDDLSTPDSQLPLFSSDDSEGIKLISS